MGIAIPVGLAVTTALASAVPTRWAALARRLPASSAPTPAITLYRDTNGWCPFCERVWLQLETKGLPYEEVLINLRDKPQWYKDMVPTTLVPAVKIRSGGTEEVVWESDVILRRLEELHPEPAMLPPDGERAAAEALIAEAGNLSSAGFRFAAAVRNASVTQEEVASLRAAFEDGLDALDAAIAEGGGPFLCGGSVGLADATYLPFLERWAVQLPLTSGFALRPEEGEPPRWPQIEGWFVAMAEEPAYARVRGDTYSWSAAVAAFQRIFATNGTLSDAQRAVSRRADGAAALELRRSAQAAPSAAAALAAAEKIIANWEAVVADATAAEPLSQANLQRLEEEDGAAVELLLADCAARLLQCAGRWEDEAGGEPAAEGGEEEEEERALCEAELLGLEPLEHKVRADAARLVSARLCAPRDMGADAAEAMRGVLMAMASESEGLAWRKSGGLL